MIAFTLIVYILCQKIIKILTTLPFQWVQLFEDIHTKNDKKGTSQIFMINIEILFLYITCILTLEYKSHDGCLSEAGDANPYRAPELAPCFSLILFYSVISFLLCFHAIVLISYSFIWPWSQLFFYLQYSSLIWVSTYTKVSE